MQKKNTTMDSLIGTYDRDLKTPAHDEYCIWVDKLFHKAIINNKTIIKKLEEKELRGKGFLKISREPKLNTLNWEEPIRNNGYVVGVPDFTFCLVYSYDRMSNVDERKISTGEFCIRGFIEVKPKIRSIGETMRQLQIYKSYLDHLGSPEEKFVILVTDSVEHIDLFEKQGFIVIVPDTAF
jgi:hypothetical protein